MKYEVEAIDDMMSRAKEEESSSTASPTRPNLGYLIEVRFSKKRTLLGALKTQDMQGLDIYRLSHGTTISDALDQANRMAQHWRYEPGGQEVLITITPQDLGITGIWAWCCCDYVIRASRIFKKMDEFHKERQSKGLAT